MTILLDDSFCHRVGEKTVKHEPENPVFRKSIAADKNHIAQIPQNYCDLLSVIFTLLIVFGVCGGAKTIFNGSPYISFVPFSVSILGIVGLVVMHMSIRGNHMGISCREVSESPTSNSINEINMPIRMWHIGKVGWNLSLNCYLKDVSDN